MFVHFKEKTTPDGEQVYFGLSKDGFHWEEVNGGNPVLWTYYGDKGVRDFTITRCEGCLLYTSRVRDYQLPAFPAGNRRAGLAGGSGMGALRGNSGKRLRRGDDDADILHEY